MDSTVNEILKGRKTFFITPDHSLLPQSFMEEYLARNYECYFIEHDVSLSLERKIDIIISLFPEVTIFFNIDYATMDISWPKFIASLRLKHPDTIFGVIYAKRQSSQEKADLEKLYLLNLGLQAGCVQLEYQKRNNFGIIDKTLYANHIFGRQRSVRAVCSYGCSFEFITEDKTVVTGKISDFSISHFTFTLEDSSANFNINVYEKIYGISFHIRGLHFKSDAVLYVKRTTSSGRTMYVFAFVNSNGQSGLDPEIQERVFPKMYEILKDNIYNLLNKLFSAAVRQPQDQYGRYIPLDIDYILSNPLAS